MTARRTSNAAKKIRATDKPSREREEHRAEVCVPEPPAELKGRRARRIYRETGAKLAGAGLLTDLDGEALAEFAQLTAEIIQAEAEVRKHGAYWTSAKTGYTQTTAAASHLLKLRRERRAVMDRLGLSPKARESIEPAPAPKDDNPANRWAIAKPELVK
jgi:P27 family predicted phage terminase small subunit